MNSFNSLCSGKGFYRITPMHLFNFICTKLKTVMISIILSVLQINAKLQCIVFLPIKKEIIHRSRVALFHDSMSEILPPYNTFAIFSFLQIR